MFQYLFEVPDEKKYRVIVHTDCMNEADDQLALAHHLLTPKFLVTGIVAGHFDSYPQIYGKANTMEASYQEILHILSLMGVREEYGGRVFRGACGSLPGEREPVASEGAEYIIREAMREDPHPLFIVCQGAVTDLASAILMKPEICSRMTAVWIGGGPYPCGGEEFNLWNDIAAANVVFQSSMPLWQIPMDVYKQISVTLAELQYRVAPCSEIGNYLFTRMAEYNTRMGGEKIWPHGECWGLGDQAGITVLLEELEAVNYDWIPAPVVDEDMHYIHHQNNRPIRVYRRVDARFTMEDFYAKLAIQFGKKN